MVASLALALAGAALIRAVSTGANLASNLSTRQQAMLAATTAAEVAATTLFDAAAIDPTRDDLPHHYFAARQAGEDRRGVPAALQSLTGYPAEMAAIDVGDGFTARHVIERLCVGPGDATIANCTLSPASVEAAAGAQPADEPPRLPYYRVSIRVDGPKGAATFVQVMLSPAPRHRLSWRMLDE